MQLHVNIDVLLYPYLSQDKIYFKVVHLSKYILQQELLLIAIVVWASILNVFSCIYTHLTIIVSDILFFQGCFQNQHRGQCTQ